jgi:hypothetical protein
VIDPGEGLFRPLVEDHAPFRARQFFLLRHRRAVYKCNYQKDEMSIPHIFFVY